MICLNTAVVGCYFSSCCW